MQTLKPKIALIVILIIMVVGNTACDPKKDNGVTRAAENTALSGLAEGLGG